MKVIFAITILNIFLMACSSTLYIKNDVSSYKELNKKIEDEVCEITLINGDDYLGENIEIGLDSSLWHDANDPTETFVQPTSEINKIMYIDRSLAMEKGFGFGILIGGGLGYLIGAQNESGGGGGSGYGPNISGGETAIGAIIGSLSGIILGVSYGAIMGDRENYVLNPLNDFYPTPIIQIAPAIIENEEGKIRLLEINKIINETDKFLTVLWGTKKVHLPKPDIIEIIEKETKLYFRIHDEIYKKYFK